MTATLLVGWFMTIFGSLSLISEAVGLHPRLFLLNQMLPGNQIDRPVEIATQMQILQFSIICIAFGVALFLINDFFSSTIISSKKKLYVIMKIFSILPKFLGVFILYMQF